MNELLERIFEKAKHHLANHDCYYAEMDCRLHIGRYLSSEYLKRGKPTEAKGVLIFSTSTDYKLYIFDYKLILEDGYYVVCKWHTNNSSWREMKKFPIHQIDMAFKFIHGKERHRWKILSE